MRLPSNPPYNTAASSAATTAASTSAAAAAPAETSPAAASPLAGSNAAASAGPRGVGSGATGSSSRTGLTRHFGAGRSAAVADEGMQPPAAPRTIALVGTDAPSHAAQAHGDTAAPALPEPPALRRQMGSRDLEHGLQAAPAPADPPAASALNPLPSQFARPILRRQINTLSMPRGWRGPGIATDEATFPDVNVLQELHHQPQLRQYAMVINRDVWHPSDSDSESDGNDHLPRQ